MDYIVSYLPFLADGTHGRVMLAAAPNEEAARAIVSDMVWKHKNEAPYIGVGYRMTIKKGAHLILEESSAL